MKKIKLFLAACAAMVGLQAYAWDAPSKPAYSTQWATPTSGQSYYIYNVGAGTFLGGGRGWGTRVVSTVDNIWAEGDALVSPAENKDYAYPFTLQSNQDGTWYLVHKGTNKANKYMFYQDGNDAYIDNNTSHKNAKWNITATENGYRLDMPNKSDKYFGVHSTNLVSPTLAYTWSDFADANADKWIYWQFVPESEASAIKSYASTAFALYDARVALYNALLAADENNVSTDEAGAVYTTSSDVTAIKAATTNLQREVNKVRFATLFAGASNDNPIDVTAYCLNNADFSAGNINGWETNYVSGVQAQNIGYQGASYTNEDVTISKFIEAWKPGATLGDGYLRQTVLGLPEGKYLLEADAIATWQNDDSRVITGAQLYITADGVTYKTDMSTKNNKPQHFSTEFLNTGEGDVIFGLRTVSANCNWLCADNFKVTFYGIDLSPYATLLAQAVAEANAIDVATLTTASAAALTAAVQANNKEWSTAKEYAAAIAAVQAATTAAKAIPVALASFQTTKAAAAGLTNVEGYTESVNGATTTFNTAINSIETNVDNATTAADVAAKEAELIVAAKTFLAGVRSDGAHPFDITFLITNPSFDNNDATGWTANPAPGFQSYTNCEYYQTEFDINQTLTGMPKGNYELKVQAFQRPGRWEDVYSAYQAGTNNVSSVIYINDGQTTIKNLVSEGATDADHQWNNGNDSNNGTVYYANSMNGAAQAFKAGNYWNSVLTAVEGDLKFGFKSTKTHVAGDWTIFDNFQLFYYGNSINVTMDEAQPFSALADIEGANVTMARTVKEGYNTVALPFDLTEAQVKEVFGDDAVVYSYSDEGEADNTTVNFTTAETKIEANVPVLVKATKAATQIVAENVTVKTGEAKVEGTNFDFVGNYGGQITLADGIWFVGNGALYKSAGATTMKGFRAYIDARNASSVKMYIDGLETAIDAIDAEAPAKGAIFNLAGQRVNNAQKGIYIVGGKKVVIK